jgi:DNA-3-methyladenine glycosylase
VKRQADRTRGAPPRTAERRRLLRGLSQPAADAARFLLGKTLVRSRGAQRLRARIVETEAYLGTQDPAAHAFRGRTERTEPIFGAPGTLYVYFVYGMHYCLNLSVDRKGVPGCVLIRAVEPLDGRRDVRSGSGPGRLCRLLAIDARWSGRHLFEPGSRLWLREGSAPAAIGVSPRVGVRLAAERPLRFFDPASPAVSPWRGPKRRPAARAAGSRAAGRAR